MKRAFQIWFCAMISLSAHPLGAEVSFSREILPLLSDRCFHCHGPDDSHRKAGLRLDLETEAKQERDGTRAISPASLEQSELWRRIASGDSDEQMPPPESRRKPLNEEEREVLRRWILEGAPWGRHWSFEAPVKVPVPGESVNPVDAFVRERLRREGLAPSPRAVAHTLLRRISFDLTGLPPTPDEVASFERDSSPAAFAGTVERLLSSPHFAERMTMWWLDAARYSDSDGFQADATRQNWPWRDWVVQAFAQNMPFDQFTIEQFAGDLLPEATPEQILATCFHRNHMTNGEGGRDPEESRVDYVIDRVNTVGTVWLGLTLGCVQCHSHKFDPIAQSDYYSLAAFFNSIDEDGKAGLAAKPYLKYTSPLVEKRVEELRQFVKWCESREAEEKAEAETRFENWLARRLVEKPENYRVWFSPEPSVTSSDGTEFRIEKNQIIQTAGPTPFQDDYRVTFSLPKEMKQLGGWKLEVLPHESHRDGKFARDGDGEFILTDVRALVRSQNANSEIDLEMIGAVADYEPPKPEKSDRLYGEIKDTLNDDPRDGWTTKGATNIQAHVGVFELKTPWHIREGDELTIVLRNRSTTGRANVGRFRISLTQERGEAVRKTEGATPMEQLIEHWPAALDEIETGLRRRLFAQWLLDDRHYQNAREILRRAKKQLAEIEADAKPRSVMVLEEREEPRDTHILKRGVWDAQGDKVSRAVLPAVLPWPEEETKTRLDLARWLVARENPLTARVVVNQLWQLMFGSGLVRTPEDFGLQGELPTHPELLDWLAVDLMKHGWDLRHVLRLIATSQTYQQSSDTTSKLFERDPENRLLARAPRFRLPAWMIRDAALRASSLLNPALGGPPVKPYQPEGVWAEITMGRFDYDPSLGPAQYRRTLYGFWRRSIAPVFLFDSAQRRVCEVRPHRTNTPLHALALLNDETMLEASRTLADRVWNGSSEPFGETVQSLALRVLSRRLVSGEITAVRAVWTECEEYYRDRASEARRYTTVGQQEPPADELAARTAAWMTVASLLLNLDEAMTHE